MNEAEFLSLVGSAEKQSSIHLHKRLSMVLKKKAIDLKDVSEFEAIPGYGIKAIVDGKEFLSAQVV